LRSKQTSDKYTASLVYSKEQNGKLLENMLLKNFENRPKILPVYVKKVWYLVKDETTL